MSMIWETPDDGIGFERYLAAQHIPARLPKALREEEVPEPEPWEEDEMKRLQRLLQAEVMITQMAITDKERAECSRDWWRKVALVLAGAFAIALVVNVAAIWWAR